MDLAGRALRGPIPFTEYSKGNYLRATAIAEDGQEANDIRMLKGPNTTIENVRVDVVQLHISALDKSNHFVKGLAETDFSIQEDGRPQKITGFEVAEKLPLTIGLVVDGSGSMDKSMPFVHDASAELFKDLIREKDKGFVIEFREQPKMVQELTSDSGSLQRAAREPQARGATALYDSVVLGLYQFRTLQGRKALVVVTDGADNHSHVDYETLLRYARSAGAPIYFIAVSISLLDFGIRKEINEIAPGIRRRGLPPRKRRQDRRSHQADRRRAAIAVRRGVPDRLAEARRRVPGRLGRGVQAGNHRAHDQGLHPVAVSSTACCRS